MATIMKRLTNLIAVLLLSALVAPIQAQDQGNARGPIGPSPYNVLTGWHTPFAGP
ncbi:MAG: hypothetical protein MK239_09190 [Gemmatimonadetes bacterium]|nr:hypothetical protein [Gemmatimonadota bacterium]